MPVLLMTGFPGFLGSSLLPLLLARRDGVRAVCLVQKHHFPTAERRVREIVAAHPHTADRIALVEGDITAPDLGLAPDDLADLEDVNEVWHLAAVYDLAVPEQVARRVNVDGTARMLDFCRSRPLFGRLQYVSTCYVSGRFDGEFTEDALDEGQAFRNHYESTKFEAELLVRKAMADGLPATIYRPGIVVGDIDHAKVCLVPRDFVIDAMDRLSVLDRSLGRTYALTDPCPPTVREVLETFARHLEKKVIWVPLPLAPTRALVGRMPGMERLLGLPAESLDYSASPTTYSTTHTTDDLAGTGISCPRFEEYAGTLLDFMVEHPEIDAAAMV